MPKRAANARWSGTLADGEGTMEFAGGAWSGAYSARSRFEDGDGTNPEELIAAAHAGCFSMALAHILAEAGHTAESIETEAQVHINPAEGGGFAINRIDLRTTARVPGISQGDFDDRAEAAKQGCPVSQALAGVPEIVLDATLEA